jgi:hypothetical protein
MTEMARNEQPCEFLRDRLKIARLLLSLLSGFSDFPSQSRISVKKQLSFNDYACFGRLAMDSELSALSDGWHRC